MMRQQWLVFLPMTLATAGLAACASMMGGQDVKVRPIESKAAQASIPHDPVYESAVSAINERDYGRALDYLQAAKAKDPGNVKILNALGVVYDKLGRFDLSARYYAQARTIEPDSKIVAENMGYSRVLQRLIDPGAPVAVANIDLPPSLPATAAESVAPAQKPAPQTVAAAMTAPTALPEAKIVAAPPVAPVVAQSIIATAPIIAEPAPVAPEAKLVAARTVAFAPTSVPAMTAPSLPAPEFIVTATRGRALSASDLSPILVKPATPVIATAETLQAAPPVTVMPAALPMEITVAPHLVTAVAMPATRAPVIPSVSVTLPAAEAQSQPAIVPAPQVAIVVSAPPPAQKKVAARSILPSAPLELPALKAEILPAMAATDPAPLVESKPVVLAAVPALPVSASPRPAPAVPAVAKMTEQAAPKVTMALPVPVAAPVLEKKPVVAMPAPQHKRPAIAAPAAPKPVVAMAAPAPQQKLPAIVAPVAPKPIKLAGAHPAPAVPAEKSMVRTLRDMLAALLPARTPVQQPAKQVAAAANAQPGKTVNLSMVKPAPVMIAAAKPDSSPIAPANPVTAKKVLMIGQPVKLLNASGKPSGTGMVLRRLATLGWTMRASEARAQPASVLFYSAQNLPAAKALQRTLPFPVRLTVDKAEGAGMRLVIGRDYLSWKPRNSRIAALWQKSAVIASLQKPIKGER